MQLIRVILNDCGRLLLPGGVMIIEIDDTHRPLVELEFARNEQLRQIYADSPEFVRDYYGVDRFLRLVRR